MVIKNARLFLKKEIIKGDLLIRNGRIAGIGHEGSKLSDGEQEVVDAEGAFAIPGLIDIHFHGAVNCDFSRGDIKELAKIAEYEAKSGVLAICPATMTYSEDILKNAMTAAREFQPLSIEDPDKADLVGINMEGPFISPNRLGAQNPLYLKSPDPEMFRRLQKAAGGLIKILDMAPELSGAMECIDELKDEVRISLAHTEASYELASEAFSHGMKHVTHLYNAMPKMNHREPGPIRAAMESDVTAELISDGVHNHPAMVRMAFEAFKDRIILISDSMEAAGLPDGVYDLGGQEVKVDRGRAVLLHDPGVIAGSVVNLFEAMKTAITQAKVPFREAVEADTINPARAIGIDRDYGSLDPGKIANIVLMDDDINIKRVISHGVEIA